VTRAARCIIELLHSPESDAAYVGAVLVAEALRTIRDWDNCNFKNRVWEL